MPAVVTTASVVSCGHSPGAVQTASTAKLRAGGAAVLTAAGVAGHPIGGCSNTNAPCTTAGSLTAGAAAKLRAGGAPVVLDTLAGPAIPGGQLTAQAGQDRLTAS